MVMSVAGFRGCISVRQLRSRLSNLLSMAGVRNLVDGRVEVLFEGEEAAVAELADWLQQGPETAEVSGLELQELALQGIAGFIVRR